MTHAAKDKVLENETLTETGYRQMVNYLEDLLSRQIERIRRYDLDSALELGEEAHQVAFALTEAGVLDRPDYTDEKFRISRIYKDLELIIETERAEVGEKLKQIRQGIRALGVYGDRK